MPTTTPSSHCGATSSAVIWKLSLPGSARVPNRRGTGVVIRSTWWTTTKFGGRQQNGLHRLQPGLAGLLAAIADLDTRGFYRAIVPQDGVHPSNSLTTPNDCLSWEVPHLFRPERIRTPYAQATPPNPDATGVSWDTTTYTGLRNALLTHTPDVPFWETAVATRQSDDELVMTPTNALTPNPNVFAQFSWYDQHQPAKEYIANWQTVTPSVATPTPSYPDKRMRIGPGSHAAAAPWKADPSEEANRDGMMRAWLWDYLRPLYQHTATPNTPGPTTPTNTPAVATPTPSPQKVEYVVDSFNNTPAPTPNLTPTFEWQGASNWPPAATVDSRLYLQSHGRALEASPTQPSGPAGTQFAEVRQTFDTPAPVYNMGTMAAEAPHFSVFATQVAVTAQRFYSWPLNQDVLLVGAPEAQLYIQPDTGVTTWQVHVRVLEEVSSGGPVVFITRANDCAWGEAQAPAGETPTPSSFVGEARAHTFKKDDRIVLEFSPIDPAYYDPNTTVLFITPYLDDFAVVVYHKQVKPSSVTLHLVPTNPAIPIFVSPTPSPVLGPMRQPGEPMATATPPPPEPLEIQAFVAPDFTNPGGWQAWAAGILLWCTGGEGQVTCPEEQLITTDGTNQSFSYEARDEAGHVATVTVSGLNIDRTPPQLTSNLPETQTFCSGATLPLEFAVSDALSGLESSSVTFNGLPVQSGQAVLLMPGQNTLLADAYDVAGNWGLPEDSVQVNYDETLAFPPDGAPVVRELPLPFKFTIADACSPDGKYGSAVGTLWLTGPDGVEIPAEWFGEATGNTFTYDAVTGWYSFDADVSVLAAGTWTARAHLDDGNEYTTSFVIP